jgi:iron-sulfur cluster repair protein YtfE (RIC family)
MTTSGPAPLALEGIAVNEIIRLHPRTVEVFKQFGIDSCCGGAAPLGEAAARHGVDEETLLAALRPLL